MTAFDEARVAVENQITENKARVSYLLQNAEFLDDDGYPTEESLEIITKWHWDDIGGWFEFIKSIWHFRDWGWHQGMEPHDYKKDEEILRYNISTGGWSGNESLIYAMQENSVLWHITWVQSRRGGHYIFEYKEIK